MNHLALVGPTASGKSALAMMLAERFGDVEIVSVDSMQVYRGMDIGTAKPSVEDQARVPHHLIDLVDPDEEFTLKQFQTSALAAIAEIEQRGSRALLVGGTGLYLQSITDGLELPGQYPHLKAELEAEPDTRAMYARLQQLDSVAAARIEPDNRRRIIRALEVTLGSGAPFSSFGPGLGAYPQVSFDFIALRMDTERNAARIEARVDDMFSGGLVDEVRGLRERFELTPTAMQAIGYKEILTRLADIDRADVLDEAVDEVKRRTRGFARRQRVWFRRDPRMHFFDVDHTDIDLLADAVIAAIDTQEWPVS